MGQPLIPPTPAGTSEAGKTIIVTGGNTGLGYEAARQFLTLGASRVILACRSISRGKEAVSALKADPEVQKANPSATVEVFELDLDDYQSGLRFTERVKKEVKELDILLNNGGMVAMKYERSKSGHERIMQVNCYTHILICLELFPLLRSTAAARGSPARVTFVGSGLHINGHTLSKKPIWGGESVLGHLDDEQIFDKMSRYADSKLAVAAYVRRLGAVAPTEVTVNHLCPGLVQTGLDKHLPFFLKPIMWTYRKTSGRTVQEGARTLIHACAVAGPDTNGKFLQHNKIQAGAPFLDEPAGHEFTDKLWTETVEDVAAIDPELRVFA
ncbi:hypothetical protein INS49_000075 [Diaporthe citri]|uniref:uncharacterized protein n=1 Tax=Diaporthe citri TaxID=83186 RepID=UPI001C8017E0|nr:uncharacterized protein INS49_000075 [Diaporthe citri]KAG6365899.1 hypothetical protein INS49_000075 [Diaporthe citri]